METHPSQIDESMSSLNTQTDVINSGKKTVDCGNDEKSNVEPPVKKRLDITNSSKKCLAGENRERINYLAQISKAIALKDEQDDFSGLDSSLGRCALSIGKKCVIRISPDLKRQMCKKCGMPLIAGLNARCRLRNNRMKHLVLTCMKCQELKRFPSNPDYSLWIDKPESLA